jgi:hypothetical protein
MTPVNSLLRNCHNIAIQMPLDCFIVCRDMFEHGLCTSGEKGMLDDTQQWRSPSRLEAGSAFMLIVYAIARQRNKKPGIFSIGDATGFPARAHDFLRIQG